MEMVGAEKPVPRKPVERQGQDPEGRGIFVHRLKSGGGSAVLRTVRNHEGFAAGDHMPQSGLRRGHCERPRETICPRLRRGVWVGGSLQRVSYGHIWGSRKWGFPFHANTLRIFVEPFESVTSHCGTELRDRAPVFACVFLGCGGNGPTRFLPESARAEHSPLVLAVCFDWGKHCAVWNGFKVQKLNGKGQVVLFLNFFFTFK